MRPQVYQKKTKFFQYSRRFLKNANGLFYAIGNQCPLDEFPSELLVWQAGCLQCEAEAEVWFARLDGVAELHGGWLEVRHLAEQLSPVRWTAHRQPAQNTLLGRSG